jgi:hypothetical protein
MLQRGDPEHPHEAAAAGWFEGEAAPRALSFGSPELRGALRETYFRGLAEPRGEDLARLDFTEAAWAALHDAMKAMGAILPRDPVPMLELAHAMGTAMAKQLARGSLTRDDLPELGEDHAWLPPSKAAEVLDLALDQLRAFRAQVCGNCQVRCIDAPDAAFAAEFYSEVHPVDLGPD